MRPEFPGGGAGQIPVSDGGRYADADGAEIHLLLPTNGGFSSMLEIIRFDDGPIMEPPSAPEIVLVPPA